MSYYDFNEDIVSEEQFRIIYDAIKYGLTENVEIFDDKCIVILGGQPGAGKSTFYSMKEDLEKYIAINGDDFRRFHPNYTDILKSDIEHYTERTQNFSNKVVETLINDLSNEGYNLIIEGTLRNVQTPIKTCEMLKSKGYAPDLVVVACDAEKAWESTLTRAEFLKKQGFAPRLVPIDIYHKTVNSIVENLDIINQKGCFNSITIIDRDNNILFDSRCNKNEEAPIILKNVLNVEKWNQNLPIHEERFINEKIRLLQASLNNDIEGRIH